MVVVGLSFSCGTVQVHRFRGLSASAALLPCGTWDRQDSIAPEVILKLCNSWLLLWAPHSACLAPCTDLRSRKTSSSHPDCSRLDASCAPAQSRTAAGPRGGIPESIPPARSAAAQRCRTLSHTSPMAWWAPWHCVRGWAHLSPNPQRGCCQPQELLPAHASPCCSPDGRTESWGRSVLPSAVPPRAGSLDPQRGHAPRCSQASGGLLLCSLMLCSVF